MRGNYNKAMQLAIEQLKKLLNLEDKDISVPPNPEMGDLSTNIAFKLSKEKGENPTITALNLMSNIDLSKTVFSKAKAFGPYINFYLDKQKIISLVLKEILSEKEKYASEKNLKKTFLLEYSSPNTNKPLHLGHLFQIVFGNSLARVLEAYGWNIKRLHLYNDRGMHICKSMLAYQKWGKGKAPTIKEDYFVGDYYVMFDKKKSDKLLEELNEMLIKWENKDAKIRALWKKMNNWCYKGHSITYKRIGMDSYDKVYYESDFYEKGKEIINGGLKKGIFQKEADGSIFADLGELGKKYLIRSHGTSLYVTQDLALAKLKEKDYVFDKSIIITGNEQDHYFKQLFKIFELLDYKSAGKNIHIGTGMIELPSGKMKSREGTVIETDELIDLMKGLAKKEMAKRKAKIDEKSCELIGLAAIKYFLLKTSSYKNIIFNPEESLSFEGNTGTYLLYSLVRAYKIIKGAGKITTLFNPKLIDSKEEFELIKDIDYIKEAVKISAQKNSIHLLANHAYKTASDFNAFYEKCQVLSLSEKELKNSRIVLVKSFILAMERMLYLLGIEPVKEM